MTDPGPLLRPNSFFRVHKRRLIRRKYLKPDEILIRAFSHLAGYSADSFNPNLAPIADPTEGGRYDGTAADPYSFTYLARPHTDPRVAFWEVMQNELRLAPTGSHQYIARGQLETRAFAYVRVVSKLELVDLRNWKTAGFFGTTKAILQASDHAVGREWAHFIRSAVPDAQGLIYTPQPFAGDSYGSSIVLFGDRCPPPALVATDPIIPMTSVPGLLLVNKSLKGSNIKVGP